MLSVSGNSRAKGISVTGKKKGPGAETCHMARVPESSQVGLEPECQADMFTEGYRGSEASSCFTGISTAGHKHLLKINYTTEIAV